MVPRSGFVFLLLTVAVLAQAARLQPAGEISLGGLESSSDDKIHAMPGYVGGDLPGNHYAGYINIDKARGKNLFYYFVQSARDRENDPVVLWLNGGPGCSSFDGFIYEHGPFNFRQDDNGEVQLVDNPFGWNQVANMIFLDSPVGVGLSYSHMAQDYFTNDTQTAIDTDAFLRGWFKRFPQYSTNDFYISGESYAGIYVPNLARQVVRGNDAGLKPQINIKGYIVGNGCTDERYDGNAHPPFAVGKSLIGARSFASLQAACNNEFWNRSSGSSCDNQYNRLWYDLADLNVYDVLEGCYHGPQPTRASANGKTGRLGIDNWTEQEREVLRTLAGRVWPAPGSVAKAGPLHNWATLRKAVHTALQQQKKGDASETLLAPAHLRLTPPCTSDECRGHDVSDVSDELSDALGAGSRAVSVGQRAAAPQLHHTPPCTDSRVADAWLNNPAVREALHARPIEDIGRWTICSDKILYTKNSGSMVPVHKFLTRHRGLRALIYSGDHDMAVPHTGSEAWTGDMGYAVKKQWQAWYVADKQVAGYYVAYDHDLTYATVKGAGHMVPENKPLEALAMFQRFIDHQSL